MMSGMLFFTLSLIVVPAPINNPPERVLMLIKVNRNPTIHLITRWHCTWMKTNYFAWVQSVILSSYHIPSRREERRALLDSRPLLFLLFFHLIILISFPFISILSKRISVRISTVSRLLYLLHFSSVPPVLLFFHFPSLVLYQLQHQPCIQHRIQHPYLILSVLGFR